MTNHRRLTAFRKITASAVLHLAGGRRLVVIAPHPDDETLGCGSLIAGAIKRGIPVGVVTLTDGDASHPLSRRWPPTALGRLRSGEQRRALARLGASECKIRCFGWGDGRVGVDGNARSVSQALLALRAGVVLVTSDADHHPDHQAAAQLARAAVARLGLPLVNYAVWSRVNQARRGSAARSVRKGWAMAAHRSQVAGYIVDDPSGFRLAPSVLASLVAGPEIFFI